MTRKSMLILGILLVLMSLISLGLFSSGGDLEKPVIEEECIPVLDRTKVKLSDNIGETLLRIKEEQCNG